MKKIEIDEELYQYIASNTQSIGESASDILRRLLGLSAAHEMTAQKTTQPKVATPPETTAPETPTTNSDAAHTSVFNLLNKEELAMQKGIVGRFLFILAALYRTHKTSFHRVLNVTGRDRRYFATSKEELTASGSSLNPKQIEQSPYWVMTNSNTTRKKMMLHEVALELGYTAEQAEKIRDFI